MPDLLTRPWPWYVGGPLIGLMVPVLLLLGNKFVSGETLLRFYVLHCVAIPLAAALLIAVHFWRVRKDGGISGPL